MNLIKRICVLSKIKHSVYSTTKQKAMAQRKINDILKLEDNGTK